ncbi:hypothetical protein [uncultured Propionibacterium sp.]|uniref:hypothetical protein n=1 Tax=uncultured Propionibacterium sp. TaxID=218066 RepID=UPI00292F3AFC|nr:hypothetical protein [uncultured Propionibacterium sp.]
MTIDDSAKAVLKDSRAIARNRAAQNADVIDVLIAAVEASARIKRALATMGVDWQDLIADAASDNSPGRRRLLRRPIGFTPEAKGLLLRASALAAADSVSAVHMARAALGQHDDLVTELLAARGIDAERLIQALSDRDP